MKVLLLILTILMSFGSFAVTEIVLTNKNTITLSTAFDWTSVAQVMVEAKKLDSYMANNKEPIYLVLDTPGGNIAAGLEMFDFLNSLNRPVYTITLFAASMGAQTVAQLGKAYIVPGGVLMHHRARGGFSGEFGRGNGKSQLDSRYGFWLDRIDMMDQRTVDKSNGKLTLKKFRALYENELWATSTTALKYGLVDDIASVKCSKGLNGTKTITKSAYGLVLTAKKSKCPTITGVFDIVIKEATSRGMMDINEFAQKGGIYPCPEEDSGFYYGEKKAVKKQPLCSNINPKIIDNFKNKSTKELLIKQQNVQKSY